MQDPSPENLRAFSKTVEAYKSAIEHLESGGDSALVLDRWLKYGTFGFCLLCESVMNERKDIDCGGCVLQDSESRKVGCQLHEMAESTDRLRIAIRDRDGEDLLPALKNRLGHLLVRARERGYIMEGSDAIKPNFNTDATHSSRSEGGYCYRPNTEVFNEYDDGGT